METAPTQLNTEAMTVDIMRQRLHNISPAVLDSIDAYLMEPANHSGWMAGERALGSCAINSLTGEGSTSLLPEVLQSRAEQCALREVEKAADRAIRLRVMGQTKDHVRDEFKGLLDEPRADELKSEIEQASEAFFAGSPREDIPGAPEELRGKLKSYYEQPEEQRQYDPYAWAHDAALTYVRAEAQRMIPAIELAAFEEIEAVDEAFAVLAEKKYQLESAELNEKAVAVFQGSAQERRMLDTVEQEIDQVEDDLLAKAEALLLAKRSEDFAPAGNGLDLVHGIRPGERLEITTTSGEPEPIQLVARQRPDAPDEIIFKWIGGRVQGRLVSIGRQTDFAGRTEFERRLIRNDTVHISGDAGISGAEGRVRDVIIDGQSLRAAQQTVQPVAVSEKPAPTQVEKVLASTQQELLKRFRASFNSNRHLYTYDLYNAADIVTLVLGNLNDNYEPEVYRELELQPGGYVNRVDSRSTTGARKIRQLEFEVVRDSWQDSPHEQVRNAAFEPGESLCVWNGLYQPQLDGGTELKIQVGLGKPRWLVANGKRMELLGMRLDDESTLPSDVLRAEATRAGRRQSLGVAIKKAGDAYLDRSVDRAWR